MSELSEEITQIVQGVFNHEPIMASVPYLILSLE